MGGTVDTMQTERRRRNRRNTRYTADRNEGGGRGGTLTTHCR
jgi:hypothetical protein